MRLRWVPHYSLPLEIQLNEGVVSYLQRQDEDLRGSSSTTLQLRACPISEHHANLASSVVLPIDASLLKFHVWILLHQDRKKAHSHLVRCLLRLDDILITCHIAAD